MSETDYELTQKIAYQAWLDRGMPIGSPEVDWDFAIQTLGMHRPVEIASNVVQFDSVTDAQAKQQASSSKKPMNGVNAAGGKKDAYKDGQRTRPKNLSSTGVTKSPANSELSSTP